jgi:hypothetical protein
MEDDRVLALLDELSDTSRRPAKRSVTAAQAPRIGGLRMSARPPAARPSPFLEERLADARGSAARLSGTAADLARRLAEVEQASAAVLRELDRASEELAFLRANGLVTPSASSALPGVLRTGSAPVRVPRDPPVRCAEHPLYEPPLRADAARYQQFTVDRYNATMDGVKARRPRVVLWSLLLAAAISTVLVLVALLSHETLPPLWLGVLPAVWMIPVPFFALSFRGTQRILHRNHFRLPEES